MNSRSLKADGASKSTFRESILIISGGASIIIFYFYKTFLHGVFVQDDPRLLQQFENPKINIVEKIFGGWDIANRWRPVANIGYEIGYLLFGKHYAAWLCFDASLLFLLVLISSVIIWKLTKSLEFTFGSMILIASSRFFFGQVLNATFLVEAIANLLLVGILYFCLNYEKLKIRRNIAYVLTLNFLLVLDHERFVTVGVALAFWIFLKRELGNLRSLLIFISILPALVLFSLKHFVFGIPIFVGTGSAWNVGFNLTSATKYLCEIILGVFGVNIGPYQLNGLVWQQENLATRAISMSLLLLILYFLYTALKVSLLDSSKRPFLRLFGLYTIASAALIVPVISTIRVEQRWFVAPFLQLIFLMAFVTKNSWKLSRTPDRRAKGMKIIFGWIVCFSMILNVSYRANINSIYFAADQESFKTSLTNLQSAYNVSVKNSEPLFIFSAGDLTQYKIWLEMFASANGFQHIKKITFVNSRNDIPFKAVILDNTTGVLQLVS